jgi:glucose/arabinose dehydrogenase
VQPFTGNKTVITDRLPGDRWHGRRVLRFAPNGLLVLAVGVPCNVCQLNRTAEGVQFGSMYSLNTTSGELRQLATGVWGVNAAIRADFFVCGSCPSRAVMQLSS